MITTSLLDSFHSLAELNRAFLGLLQARVRAQQNCLGLPPTLRSALNVAGAAELDTLAAFPRALFRLRVDAGLRSEPPEPDAAFDAAAHAVNLSILLSMRHICRQSAYRAGLLFDLERPAIERLAALPWPELQYLASSPTFLDCALTERTWFWRGLLTGPRPEARRQITLMALQPRLSSAWPQRRPPRAAL